MFSRHYVISIKTLGELALTDVDNIKKSSIFLATGDEYVKILETSEGYIRKAVFFDNVRDFQGLTGINNDVLSTVKEHPESFILLNNGITVICDSFEQQNKLIKIKNPQIVNGCQTSNVLFLAKQQGLDLTKVSVAMKLIDTSDDEIVNAIVRGTNKQNLVYEVAFETTRTFHKELEKFFEAMASEEPNDYNKLYYERRSKQYYDRTDIKLFQKINVKIIIQSFISIFLKKPHLGHRYESILIKQFGNSIFIDGQNLYQYYISSMFYIKLEMYFAKQWSERKYLTAYKNQIMFIFSELIAELMPEHIKNKPSINDNKMMNEYCRSVHKLLLDETIVDKYVKMAVDSFKNIRDNWIIIRGSKFKYSIKDSEDFTAFMLKYINASVEISENTVENVGIVIKVGLDKYMRRYCFIKCNPNNLFAHSVQSDVDFDLIEYGMSVVYKIHWNKLDDSERAIIMRIIE